MLKTTGYVTAIGAIGTLAIAWSHTQRPQRSIPVVETISPESLTVGRGSLFEMKFDDRSFVFN